MANRRTMAAIERIERALGRIEAASESARAAPDDGGELLRLREAHQALRGQVEQVIGQIDALIAEREAR